MQLYSDILPNDKPKRKGSRKKDGESSSAGGEARTLLSSLVHDITAPPIPSVSDIFCPTPTRASMNQLDVPFLQDSGLASSSELERQLSVSATAQQRVSSLGLEFQRGPLTAVHLEVKVGVVCSEIF